jgi:hypothetical protein
LAFHFNRSIHRSFGTNLFHKWAHQKNPPLLAQKLQKMGLILTPDRHNKHHRDYRKSFCVTSGWLNFILDYTRFFLILERFFASFLMNQEPKKIQLGEGTISGYLSIFFSLVSFGAVICFLFPEYFTTEEFRSYYPIAILRMGIICLLIFLFYVCTFEYLA